VPDTSQIAEQIKALKAAQTIVTTPERVGRRRVAGEEPVTAESAAIEPRRFPFRKRVMNPKWLCRPMRHRLHPLLLFHKSNSHFRGLSRTMHGRSRMHLRTVKVATGSDLLREGWDVKRPCFEQLNPHLLRTRLYGTSVREFRDLQPVDGRSNFTQFPGPLWSSRGVFCRCFSRESGRGKRR